MEVVSGDRVAEGMKYLQWDIENEREKGVKKKEENVWSRFKNMEEKYFAMKMSELVTPSLSPSGGAVGGIHLSCGREQS